MNNFNKIYFNNELRTNILSFIISKKFIDQIKNLFINKLFYLSCINKDNLEELINNFVIPNNELKLLSDINYIANYFCSIFLSFLPDIYNKSKDIYVNNAINNFQNIDKIIIIFFNYYKPKEVIILLNLFNYAKDIKSIKIIKQKIENQLKLKYDEYPIKNYYFNNECEFCNNECDLHIYKSIDNKYYQFHLCNSCKIILNSNI